MYFADNDIVKGAPYPEDVKWLRPEEIVKELAKFGDSSYEDKSPLFIEGGASSNDVRQSKYLGDCYFISALSLVASDDSLLRGSFDPLKNNDGSIDDAEVKAMSTGIWPPMFHHFSKFGIYVLRFFKEFGWKYVIIDDRLPCKDGGEIVYG